MRLKEKDQTDSTTPIEAEGHAIESSFTTTMGIVVKCHSCFGSSLSSFLNLGSAFANHASLITGNEGLEGIAISRSIFEDVEIDEKPDNYFEDMLKAFQEAEDATMLHIVFLESSDIERSIVHNLLTTYLESVSNGFKPTRSAIENMFKRAGAVKIGSIADLMTAIKQSTNQKIN